MNSSLIAHNGYIGLRQRTIRRFNTEYVIGCFLKLFVKVCESFVVFLNKHIDFTRVTVDKALNLVALLAVNTVFAVVEVVAAVADRPYCIGLRHTPVVNLEVLLVAEEV